MDSFVRRFILASLVWLGVGVVIGLSMAFWPGEALVYRPAHMHANLLGFVSMMIFGVAYHVIPRFSGQPLRSPALADAHVWIANLGLALLVSGWVLRVWWLGPGTGALHAGATLSALGAFLFIYNVWATIAAASSPVRAMHGRPGIRLPVARGAAPTSANRR